MSTTSFQGKKGCVKAGQLLTITGFNWGTKLYTMTYPDGYQGYWDEGRAHQDLMVYNKRNWCLVFLGFMKMQEGEE